MAVSLDFLCVWVFVNTPVMAPTKHQNVLSSLLCDSLFWSSTTTFFFSLFRISFLQMTYVSSWFVRRLNLMTSTPVGRSSWADSTRTKMLSEEHTIQVMKGQCWNSPPSVTVKSLYWSKSVHLAEILATPWTDGWIVSRSYFTLKQTPQKHLR